jgi:hypothetical protein
VEPPTTGVYCIASRTQIGSNLWARHRKFESGLLRKAFELNVAPPGTCLFMQANGGSTAILNKE